MFDLYRERRLGNQNRTITSNFFLELEPSVYLCIETFSIEASVAFPSQPGYPLGVTSVISEKVREDREHTIRHPVRSLETPRGRKTLTLPVEDERSPRSAQRLVSSRGDDVGVPEATHQFIISRLSMAKSDGS